MKRSRNDEGSKVGKVQKFDEKKEIGGKIVTTRRLGPEAPVCPQCQDQGLVLEDHREGNMVCQRCGLVVGDRVISDESEWRNFADDGSKKDDPNRVGGPESDLLADLVGLSTRIADDGSGLSRANKHAGMEAQQRAFMEEFRELAKWANKHDLPANVTYRAQELYKGFRRSIELKGSKKNNLSAVCMFIAAREKGTPRLLAEIAQVQALQKKDITRLYSKIRTVAAKDPEIKALVKNSSLYKGNEKEMLPRFCSQLNLPYIVETAARDILDAIRESAKLEGRQPATLAGVAILLAVRYLKKEEPDISKVVGITTQTIENVMKKVGNLLEDPKLLEKLPKVHDPVAQPSVEQVGLPQLAPLSLPQQSSASSSSTSTYLPALPSLPSLPPLPSFPPMPTLPASSSSPSSFSSFSPGTLPSFSSMK